MCRTTRIDYACGHKISFRTSTCRGVYGTRSALTLDTHQSTGSEADFPRCGRSAWRSLPTGSAQSAKLKPDLPACRSPPTLIFKGDGECGRCQLTAFKAEWERRLDGARRLLAAAELEGGQREWGQARGEYDGAEGEEDRADAVTKRDNTERVERRVGKARQRTQELDEEYQRLKWKADRGFPWEKSILNTKPPVVRSRKCNGGSPLRRKIDVIAMEGDALAETDEAKESAANTAFDPSVVTEEDVQQLAAVRGSCWRTASAVDTIYLLYENSEDYASSWDAGSCESQEVPTQQPGSSSGYWDPAIDAEDSSSRVSAWYSSTSARIEADATPNVAYFGALALSESSAKTAAETEVETAAPDLEDSESEIDLRETQTAQAGVNRTPPPSQVCREYDGSGGRAESVWIESR